MKTYFVFSKAGSLLSGDSLRLEGRARANSPKKAIQKLLDQTEVPPDNYTSTGVDDADYVAVPLNKMRGYAVTRGGLI